MFKVQPFDVLAGASGPTEEDVDGVLLAHGYPTLEPVLGSLFQWLDTSGSPVELEIRPFFGSGVAFRSFLQGWDSAMDHTAVVFVRDQQEWESLWKKHSANRESAPRPPAINFADSFVIAFFAGPRGSSGHEVAVRRISEHPGKFSLEVEEKHPGRGCMVLTSITSPFHFVTIPRRDKNWAFDFTLSRKETRCI